MGYHMVVILMLFIISTNASYSNVAQVSMIPDFNKTDAIIVALDDAFFLQEAASIERKEALIKLFSQNPEMHFVVLGTRGLQEKAETYLAPFKNTTYLELNLDKMSTWARDWVPRILSNGYLVNFFGGSPEDTPFLEAMVCDSLFKLPEGPSAPAMEAMQTHVALISEAIFYSKNMYDIQGGDLLVGKNGECFTAGNKSNHDGKAIPGCKELHVLPELPGEETGHIDIFAQIINENTVMVANYKSNKKQSAKFLVPVLKYKCDEESIVNQEWKKCEVTNESEFLAPKAKGDRGNNGELQDQFDWVAHSQEVAAYFEKLGYKVELVDQPLPVHYEQEDSYLDSNNNKIRSIKNQRYFFPTFINSILMNDSVAVPVFAEYATQEENENAEKAYRKYKSKVTTLEQSSGALLGGGPHCWSSNLLEVF